MSSNEGEKVMVAALFKIASLVGALFLLSGHCGAVSVGSEAERCPLCEHEYMVTVLLSYNNFDGSHGPPTMPPSSCPFCLVVWVGDPPKRLTDEQRKALKTALQSWPEELSASEKRNLLQQLDQQYNDDVRDRIHSALQARCAAALNGKELPRFKVEQAPREKEDLDWGRKDHETFLEELPRLIEAQKRGKEAVIKPESELASEDIVTLHQAQREILNGNALAFEYFVRWAVAVNEADLMDGGRTLGDVYGNILYNVARSKKLPWPEGVDLDKARSPFAAASLKYAYDPKQPLEGDLRKVIKDYRPYSRMQMALMAAAGKKDRAATNWISSIEPSKIDMYGEAFNLYYQRVGKAEDLNFLERCASNAMSRFKETGEGWRFDDPLQAHAVVRLKCLLRGDAVGFAPGK